MYFKPLAILPLALFLAACGGGGDDGDTGSGGGQGTPTNVAAISGAWQGTSPDGTLLNAVVLDDGQLWLVGALRSAPAVQVYARTQGGSGQFQSNNVRYVDYASNRQFTGTLQGTYVAGSSISANLALNGAQAGTYNLTPIPKTTFDYHRAASLSDLAGSWTSGSTRILVGANGAVQTVDSTTGCNSNGTVAPHASKKNVFDLSVTFGAAPCSLPGQKLDGIVVTWAAGGQSTLLATALNQSASLTLVAARQ
ncbi:hypothetical protein [Ottowia thiooxydans]|uniref:hypothetical protein n=1 Tax=Ottowia thiooxydans TaxID=219182 RepID=UPI0004024968|nr:hypothetical protein [Ottowia thiooxydans]